MRSRAGQGVGGPGGRQHGVDDREVARRRSRVRAQALPEPLRRSLRQAAPGRRACAGGSVRVEAHRGELPCVGGVGRVLRRRRRRGGVAARPRGRRRRPSRRRPGRGRRRAAASATSRRRASATRSGVHQFSSTPSATSPASRTACGPSAAIQIGMRRRPELERERRSVESPPGPRRSTSRSASTGRRSRSRAPGPAARSRDRAAAGRPNAPDAVAAAIASSAGVRAGSGATPGPSRSDRGLARQRRSAPRACRARRSLAGTARGTRAPRRLAREPGEVVPRERVAQRDAEPIR